MQLDKLSKTFCTTIAVTTVGLLLTAGAASGGAKLTGPITGGEKGMPFSTPTVDVEERGYVTEEYFLEGKASAYRLVQGTELTADGKWQTERETESVPYKTRFLVVRPADAAAFNGTVIVHWQNVTAGYELGSVTDDEYLRGYAWVGVSAQAVGINGFPTAEAAGLKQWDEKRYASLNHPGDAYSYDIFTQAARAIGPERAKSPVDPMGGLAVERLVAAGASQSASRLRTYINGVHPLEGVFDGFIPYIDFASPVPFASDRSGSGRRQRVSSVIREDLGVPVFVVNSETETEAYFGARQADTDNFRFWEVPGTSHVNVVRLAAHPEGLDSPNWMSYRPAYDAAVRHMHVWLAEGKTPPVMPPIEATNDGGVVIARDELGNARGGVRLPDFAVPSAEHRGRGKPVAGGNRFAFLYGYARDFSAEELAELYPNRQVFLGKYDAALEHSLSSGVIVLEDVERLREQAVRWPQILPAAP